MFFSVSRGEWGEGKWRQIIFVYKFLVHLHNFLHQMTLTQLGQQGTSGCESRTRAHLPTANPAHSSYRDVWLRLCSLGTLVTSRCLLSRHTGMTLAVSHRSVSQSQVSSHAPKPQVLLFRSCLKHFGVPSCGRFWCSGPLSNDWRVGQALEWVCSKGSHILPYFALSRLGSVFMGVKGMLLYGR